jgi:hypothetical protein
MPLNLSALLSHALVAFTIELDNEYEHRTIHRTTVQRAVGGDLRGPWLTSFAMYANCTAAVTRMEAEAASAYRNG